VAFTFALALISIVSGPLAAHPKDEAPYGTGEDGAKEYAVCRVVAGMPGEAPTEFWDQRSWFHPDSYCMIRVKRKHLNG